MKYVKKIVKVGHMLYVPVPTLEARKYGLKQGSLVGLFFNNTGFSVRCLRAGNPTR